MNLWRLLHARLRQGRGRVLLVLLAASLGRGVLIMAFAGRLVGETHWSLPLTFQAMFLLLSLTALGEVWVCTRVALWFSGLGRQIRRALLSAWIALEPAARQDIDADRLADAVSATPRGLARLIAARPAVAFSLLTTLGCMATCLLVAPAAGAALVLCVKLTAIARIAILQRRNRGQMSDGAPRIVEQSLITHHAGPRPTDPATLRDLLDATAPRRTRQNAAMATDEALAMAARPALAIILVVVTRLSGAEPVEALSLVLVAFLLPLDWVAAIPLIAQLAAATDRLAGTEAEMLTAAGRWPELPPRQGAAPPGPLELHDAMLRYDPHPGVPGTVVGPLTVRAAPGEIALILGGAQVGKTSALRMLAGLVRLDSGDLRLNGAPADPRDVRDRVWLVPRDPVVLAGQTILGPERPEVAAWRDELGLDGVADLSGGALPDPSALGISVRARLALLLAFASDRPVLLLDEPGLWLDPATRTRLFQAVLPRLREAGRAIVITSTDARLIPIAGTVLRLERGLQVAA